MTNRTIGARESFIIPSRTLRGSREEMLQDIDQAIVGLLALRHLVGAGDGLPPDLAPRHRGASALDRLWAWLGRLPVSPGRRPDHSGSPEAS
jgi:hypothetical protein